MAKDLTKRNSKNKSVIRNASTVFKPFVFEDINYLLEGKHSLTDVDGQLEYNGNLFIIEDKTHYNSINGGQLISLFQSVYTTWKSGKIGQLVYRVSTGRFNGNKEPLFDYVVFGSVQFQQYEAGKGITPFIVKSQSNHWLAKRLRTFQEACNLTWDSHTNIRNNQLFNVVDLVKKELARNEQ